MKVFLNLQETKQYNFTFKTEKECYLVFRKIFPNDFFNNKYFLFLSRQIFRYLRQKLDKKLKYTNLYEALFYFLHGIDLPSQYIEDYPIHKAVWENDFKTMKKFLRNKYTYLFYHSINIMDSLGVTPILLAVYLQREKLIRLMMKYPKVAVYCS